MNITDLTPKELRKAADLQEKIQSLQKELSSILGGEIPIPAQVIKAPGRRKRRMSAAGRRAIAAGARARWAKIKGTKVKATGKPKRKMSAAGRARLSALAKARWKKAKAAGKGTL